MNVLLNLSVDTCELRTLRTRYFYMHFFFNFCCYDFILFCSVCMSGFCNVCVCEGFVM